MGEPAIKRWLIVGLARLATSSFLGRLSDWHIRAQLAYAAERAEKEPMRLDDVVPWSATKPKAPNTRISSLFPEDEPPPFPRITESGLPDQFGKEPSNVRAFKTPPST